MQGKKGKVYIIGAGPGDPGLITVKGFDKIKKADVILYDFLASKELLKFAKPKAEIICVGKKDGMHLLEQSQINSLLYKKARNGKTVVRLKGGDPFIFSRGVDEALYLKRKGIDFEIIQGITSAFAAPESFGIPLTKKGMFSSVAVLTGRKSNKDPIDAPKCDTLVYLMSAANVRNVVDAIIKSGRDKNTPCAFVERGTAINERIIVGKLSDIVRKTAKEKLQAPAVFIVGKITRYGKKIYAYKYKKK